MWRCPCGDAKSSPAGRESKTPTIAFFSTCSGPVRAAESDDAPSPLTAGSTGFHHRFPFFVLPRRSLFRLVLYFDLDDFPLLPAPLLLAPASRFAE